MEANAQLQKPGERMTKKYKQIKTQSQTCKRVESDTQKHKDRHRVTQTATQAYRHGVIERKTHAKSDTQKYKFIPIRKHKDRNRDMQTEKTHYIQTYKYTNTVKDR